VQISCSTDTDFLPFLDSVKVSEDLKSNYLSLNEATDVAQNRPLWKLMSTFGATSS